MTADFLHNHDPAIVTKTSRSLERGGLMAKTAGSPMGGMGMKFTTAIGIVGALAMCAASTAIAFERGQLRETRQMALDLAISAKRVHARAEAQADTPFFRGSERRMLGALKRFSESADQFDEALDTYWSNPSGTRSTLALLNEDAAVVNRSIRRAQPMASVIRDWDKANSLLDKINQRFTDRDERTLGAAPADERWYTIDGARYPRRGNRYLRDGNWIEIQTTATASAGTPEFVMIDGVRYQRQGDRYLRGGRWIAIPAPSVKRQAINAIVNTLIKDE